MTPKAPGSLPLARPEPIIRADDVAYVMFQKPDLDLLERFRTDRVRGAYLDVDRRDWIPTKPAY